MFYKLYIRIFEYNKETNLRSFRELSLKFTWDIKMFRSRPIRCHLEWYSDSFCPLKIKIPIYNILEIIGGYTDFVDAERYGITFILECNKQNNRIYKYFTQTKKKKCNVELRKMKTNNTRSNIHFFACPLTRLIFGRCNEWNKRLYFNVPWRENDHK